MMNFREFKDAVITSLRGYLTPRYGEFEIREHQVLKNNCTLTGLSIDLKEVPGLVSPTFYMEPYYKEYQSGYEFDEVMEHLEMQVRRSMEDRKEILEQVDLLRESKDKICFDLIHTKQNQELLEGIPHRDFMNMSVVYRVMLSANEEGMASVLITNQLAEHYGLNEQELYDLAYENTKKILEPEVRSMAEAIADITGVEEGSLNELLDLNPFYVVSNCFHQRGAINVMYPEVIGAIAEKVGSDLYLLPSSTHEMFASSTERIKYEELVEMLHEVNPTLDVEDRLSNDIYKYDRAAQSFEQVTDYSELSLVDVSEGEGFEMSM